MVRFHWIALSLACGLSLCAGCSSMGDCRPERPSLLSRLTNRREPCCCCETGGSCCGSSCCCETPAYGGDLGPIVGPTLPPPPLDGAPLPLVPQAPVPNLTPPPGSRLVPQPQAQPQAYAPRR